MTYADVFAGYEAKRGLLRKWVAKHYIAEFNLSGSLLDAGCGTGFWSGLFADAGFTVRSFDSRPDLVAEARRCHMGIKFSVADAEKPLRFIGKYDTVFARTLPQFYATTFDGAERLTANLLKHVKPGGILLLSIYSDGTGQDHPTLSGGMARHHTDRAIAGAIARVGGRITKRARVGNYLQLAVTP